MQDMSNIEFEKVSLTNAAMTLVKKERRVIYLQGQNLPSWHLQVDQDLPTVSLVKLIARLVGLKSLGLQTCKWVFERGDLPFDIFCLSRYRTTVLIVNLRPNTI
jgi:hypothetical protein